MSGVYGTVNTSLPLDGDLAAIAAIPDTSAGLYRKTAANAAAVVPVGVTGLASIAANTQKEGRTAIDAVSPLYVQSRSTNLVTNGSGLLLENYNFTSFVFDPTETYAGGGSFRRSATTPYSQAFSDEFIPVDPSRAYQLSLYAKSGNANGTEYNPGNIQYLGVAAFDIDRNAIGPINFMRRPGAALTTLAAPLNPGATTIQLVSGAGWSNGGNPWDRFIRWWPYTNSQGFAYAPYTYTRNIGNFSLGDWNTGGLSGNTITLRVPWSGPALPAGTPVANGASGQAFKYIAIENVPIPNVWTYYSGKLLGIDTLLDNNPNRLPPGTAFVKLLWLPNHPSGGVGNTVRFSNLSLTDNIAENLDIRKATTFQIAGGATQTASLRGAKTVTMPSPGDSISVPGAAVGDVVRVSRGLNPWVSAPGVVTFDSTGLSGVVVSAIVERFV